MKRKLFLLVTILMLCASIFALSSCNSKDSKDDANATPVETTTYSIEGSLSVDVVYGTELNLDNLKILKTTADGKTEKISVTEDMIISGSTNTIGRTPIVFMYEGYSFTKWINVKYEVIFKSGDTVLKTQYVTSADEIKPPTLLSDDYTVFLGWSPSISGTINNNVTYTAIYEQNVPELITALTAEYGTKLSEITLPSNPAGDWKFVDSDTTAVGTLGKHTFNVNFVLKNGEAVKSDKVTINVTKRNLKLVNLVTEFTYNGQPQIPTFEFENYTVDPSYIVFIQDGVSNYTNAGTYSYEFYIDDPNCEGQTSLSGTYVIKKATATVTIGNYEMTAVDSIPEIKYSVTDTDLTSAQIGISIVTPNVTLAGVYQIDAVASNSANVTLTVNRGTLTIKPAYLNIDDIDKPIIYHGDIKYDFNLSGMKGLSVTYEDDSLEDFVFSYNSHGFWAWEELGEFGDAKETAYIYKAIFTHIDSRYEPLVYEIPVTVSKKTLYFHFSNTTVDYNGKEQGISYEIYENADPENKGKKYEGLSLLGYERKINAGTYSIILSLNETNYKADGVTNFTINKINPTTDFSTIYEEIWSGSLNLDKIALPDGYSWIDGATSPTVGTYEYEAKFTPADTVNYNVIYGTFTVTVKKATVIISMNESTFDNDMVYNGDAFVIPSIAVNGTHTESALTYAYYDKDGNLLDGAINVGTYKVIITLPETEHYNVATVETEVYITKADNNDAIAAIQNATYGDSIDVLTLPTNSNGTWTWLTDATTVGNAGDNTFTAKYTDVSGNYFDREVTVTVKVAKKAIAVPTPENSTAYVYTGSEYTLEFAYSPLYTVSTNSATFVGAYTATLTLTDPDNYAWEGLTASTAGVNFRIARAENAWINVPNADKTVWTYLDASAIFTASAKFGTVVIEYTKDGITYTSEVPTTAGNYTARFTVEATDDYLGITDTVSFTINKKVVNVPEANDGIYSFVYTGGEFTLGFTESELYTVSNNKATNVNNYKALITLTDAENYIWETGALESVTVDFAITKAQAVITDFAFAGWTYGATANNPAASTNFGTIVFSYYQDGVKLAAKPTNAGTYTVKATVLGTSNFDGAESELEFVIAKATASISATGTYTFTYSGNNNEIKNVTGSHNETTVVLTLDGGEVIIVNAGTYTVKAYLEETTNYLAAELDITVVVNKADNTDTVNVNQNAVYGDSIDVLALPTNANGTWTWLTDATTVGNAGDNTFTAKYTDVSGNYLDREVTVTVKVAKKAIAVPTPENSTAYVYTGSEYTLEFAYSPLYTVSTNSATFVGAYTATLTLTDPDNYAWEGLTASTAGVNFRIARAENAWITAPNADKTVWTYLDASAIFAAEAKFGTVVIEYTKDGITYSSEVPTTAGNYTARFTVEATDDYFGISDTISFTINKKVVNVPEANDGIYSFVYTGSEFTLGFADSELYTVSNNKATNVNNYNALITLTDAQNYIWETGALESVTVGFAITKAQAVITDFAFAGWTYGATANNPAASTNFGTIVFSYYQDGVKLAAKPTNAGTYTVKATVLGTSNFDGAESELEFVIAKATASISATGTYTFTYSGNNNEIKNVTGSHNETTVVLTLDGGEVIIVNAGTYTVKAYLEETTNYLAAELDITVVVNKANNTDTVNVNQNATYGDSIGVLTLPTNVNGTWTWLTDATTVGNAGDNTFIAKYTDVSGNYLDREVIVTVKVAKATVNVPTVEDKEYDGNKYEPAIPEDSRYSVKENNGGTDKGEYKVILELTDSANYTWATTSESTVTITYMIEAAINSWTEGPSISSTWVYGSVPTIKATAKYGDVKIEYAVFGATDFTESLPTDVGSYIVKFTTKDTNYTILTATSSFTITKKIETIPAPDMTTFVYTGEVQAPEITKNDDVYTVTYSDVNSVNAGSYKITLSLVDNKNYAWADGSVADIIYTYEITQANAGLNASVEGWTYGESANEPTYTADFAVTGVYFLYAGIDGNYSATVPTLAGSYTVKAVYGGDDNIAASESATFTFTIAKANASIGGYVDTYTTEYNGSEYVIEGVTDTNPEADVYFTYYKNEVEVPEIITAGTYKVVITLPESANYNEATVEVTVIVNKKANTDTIPTYNMVYGDTLSMITLPASATGTWSWATPDASVGNANAAGNTHTAIFTPNDSENYASREADVTVIVAKKVVATPAVPDANKSQVYTGAELSVGIADTELYTVSGGVMTNAGTHTVTITLTDSNNYAWNDAGNTDASVTVQFSITKAENEWVQYPTISKDTWTFGEEGATNNSEAKFGTVRVLYLYRGTTAVDTIPTEAGDHKIVFIVYETENYTGLEEIFNFRINKKPVTAPTISENNFVYNGEVQAPEITKNDDVYTVTYGDVNSVNAGSYTITLSLVDNKNYAWADGSVADIIYTYEITQANAGLNASVEGWTYGESANEPTYTADFAVTGVYFLYAGIDGNYSATVPTLAGSYTVKAVYGGDDNIAASESATFTFTIAKANASIGGYVDTYTTEYNGSEYVIEGVTDTNPEADVYFTYYKNEVEVPEIITAGTYKVVITLPESANYNEATVEVTVIVNKKANTDTIPTYNMVYGDTLSMITLPASATGTWSWATPDASVGNANAAGNTHTAIFTPNDSENYASREADVTVIVAKKVVATPAVPDANKSQVYTGAELSVGIADTELYTVSGGVMTNAGTHTVTITLTDSNNYAWNDAGNTDTSVTVQFSITKAENEWMSGPSLSKTSWGWGEENAVITAVPEFGTVNISYLANGTDYSATMPLSIGTHTVVISVEGNDNYTGLEATLSYTINVKYVTVPTPNKTVFVYNGSVQTPTIEENATYYTITYSNSVNVGPYTVTLELVNKEYTRWASGTEGSLDNVTYEYQIIPAQAEITGFSAPTFEYAAPKDPTVTSNFGSATFTYTDKDGNVIDDISAAVPGTYYVTTSIAGTDNYAGVTSSPVEFTITPASPELSGYGAVENSTLQNSVVLDTSGLSASYNGVNVTGTFSYSGITFIESTGSNKSSYVELTFVPNDTTYYKTTTIKVYMALKTVAKIGSTAFGTIENALSAAVSGNEVIVLPDTSGNIIIKESVIIKSGVTLVIPYGSWDAPVRNTFSSKVPNVELGYTNDYEPQDAPIDSIITLADGMVIENYGIIEISGQLSGGAVQKYAGYTGGHHARLLLGTNSSIVCQSGSEILCAGYINERSHNNGSIVIMNDNSIIYEPIPIMDYINGNYAYAYNQAIDSMHINAFNRICVMNVSSIVRFNYGSSLSCWASLHTSSTGNNNTTLTSIIGSTSRNSKAVICLTDSKYSYIVAKYDPNTEITDLRVYGGANTNVFEAKVNTGLSTETVSTKNALFGITYLYHVTLAKNSELGQEHATFDMEQQFKIMTGAVFVIEEGVTVNINELTVYESFIDTHYPDDPSLHYPDLPAGRLIVNGTLICNKFGGKLYSENEGALVIIKQQNHYKAYEPGTVSGIFIMASVDYFTEINAQPGESQNAILVGNSVVDALVGITYRYENGEWVPMQITFDTDGGNSIDSIYITGNTYPALPTPSKDGFVFVAWYYGDTLVKEGDALISNLSHTLKATWKTGIGVALNINGGTCSTSAVDAIKQADGSYIYDSLPTPTREGHNFLGWYYDGVQVNTGDVLKSSSSHTLVAMWEVKSYKVTTSASNATISGVSNNETIAYGTVITINVTFSQSDSRTIEVKDASGAIVYQSSSEGNHTFTMPASDITIKASSSSSSCVTPDTLITLADGTQVRVDSLTGSELLLVWNMNTGMLDFAPIMFVDSDAETEFEIIHLYFSDGTEVKVISEHGFWDYDLNKYVYLDRYADKYIGHTFAKQNGDSLEKVQLVNVVITNELSTAWSPVTVEHLCYFVNGMLSMPGGVGGLFNIFEIDAETMTYDFEAMQNDIEKYGLYTYEELNAICPLTEDMFYAAGGAYLKISIAKGNLTEEELFAMINRYSKFV